ncbi:MAG: hypothetical protein IJS71_04635 [Clostridia bacterium]|nr:hypothetical protein [Clostridia bacterium]
MKKRMIVVVLLVLILVIPACHNKEKSAIDLITGQYFDWTHNENEFVIEGSLYHTVNIHVIAREDLETSTVVSEAVHIKTGSDDRRYVEQGREKNNLTYYLIRCEKLGLYLLVPYYDRSMLPWRALGFCLEPLDESEAPSQQ